jgi:hypothetical protein
VAMDDWPAGYELTVTVDGIQYPFASIDYNQSARPIDRSNSKYEPGYEITKGGSKKLKFSADGPYHKDEVPLTVGEEYECEYKPYDSHIGFPFVGTLLNINHKNDVNGGPNMAIEVENSEGFDAAFS